MKKKSLRESQRSKVRRGGNPHLRFDLLITPQKHVFWQGMNTANDDGDDKRAAQFTSSVRRHGQHHVLLAALRLHRHDPQHLASLHCGVRVHTQVGVGTHVHAANHWWMRRTERARGK